MILRCCCGVILFDVSVILFVPIYNFISAWRGWRRAASWTLVSVSVPQQSCIQLYPELGCLGTVINLQQDKYRVDTATAGQGPVLQQAE